MSVPHLIGNVSRGPGLDSILPCLDLGLDVTQLIKLFRYKVLWSLLWLGLI